MFGGLFGGGKNKAAEAARAEELARQQRIREGIGNINSVFDSQFDDAFFTGRRDAYSQYAAPQLQQQHQDAQKELAYYLARTGLSDSSVRAQKEADLSRLYDTNSRTVSDKAMEYETNARNSVADARASLISQLNVTGNADQASRDATSRATALSQGDAYSPLTNLFSDFIGLLGRQAAQERAEAQSGGAYRANVNTGLFGPKTGAVRVSGG